MYIEQAGTNSNGLQNSNAVVADTSFGVCAFIDLLGFSEEVLNAKSLDDIQAIRDRLERVREQFDFAAEGTTLDVQIMYSKDVLAFSDSIIAYFPLSSKVMALQGDFDPVFSELAGFALAQGMGVVDRGDFVRGGIELGWWYRQGPTLISEALVEAYRLESRVDVPVLAIGQSLFAHVTAHKHRDFYAAEVDPVETSFRLYEGIYKGKQTTFYYLDYIRVCIESLDAWDTPQRHAAYLATPSGDARQAILDEGYASNIEQWFILHAARVVKAHSEASDTAKSKYVWLAAYHNEKRGHYMMGGSGVCVL
jgi:hypothetical protein